MSEISTYKIVQIAGTSPDGIDAAMRNGVRRAAQTLRNLDWVEVVNIRGNVDGETIQHFQVEMKIGFRIEDA
jgi:flavin-binding protein dodecin